MNRKISLIPFIILITLFIGFYFYFDYLQIEKIIAIPIIGVFTALVFYFLLRLNKTYIKAGVIFLLSATLILVSFLLKKDNSKRRVTNELLGDWQSDTIGGFSINVNIQNDSAYLSQSNLDIIKPYAISIKQDSLLMSNSDLQKKYSWKFSLKNKGTMLYLFNENDSLILQKVEEN